MKKLTLTIMTLAISFLVVSSFCYAQQNVTLHLDMYINDNLVKPIVLKGHMGESFTVKIDGEVKYDIIPSMQNDLVKLSTVYYVYNDGKYVQKKKPILTTALNKEAIIEIGTEDVKVYKMVITPQS